MGSGQRRYATAAELADELRQRAGAGWNTVISPATAILIAEALETYQPDLSRLNHARARKGRIPLLGTRPVTIDLSRPIARASRSGRATSSAELTAHFVRGHFKIRKTGVFWWSPYIRGDAGEVSSGPQYNVTMRHR